MAASEWETGMNFETATDELRSFVLIEQIAAALGVSEVEVRKMRRSTGGNSAPPAPPGWEIPVAALARQQAQKLIKLADSLAPQP